MATNPSGIHLARCLLGCSLLYGALLGILLSLFRHTRSSLTKSHLYILTFRPNHPPTFFFCILDLFLPVPFSYREHPFQIMR